MMKLIALVSLVSFLPACMHTKYGRPVHALPTHFTHHHGQNCQEESLACWWQQFNDPHINQLIEEALTHNYTLEIAHEQIIESLALYQFKNAQLYPHIDGFGAALRTRFSEAFFQEFQSAIASARPRHNPFTALFFGINSYWELDFWGKIRHARNAQLHTVEAQVEHMHDVFIIIAAQVARYYIELCALNLKKDLVQQQITVHERLVTLLTDLQQAGIASAIPLLAEQQIVAVTRVTLEQISKERELTIHQLAVLLGKNPEEFCVGTTPSAVPLADYVFCPGMPSDLLRRRPDIRQAERLAAAAHEEIGSAIADWFPRFAILGGVSSQANGGRSWFTGRSLSWNIGPGVRWPIINFGEIRANIHVQESRKRQAVLRYSQTIIEALKEVEDYLVSYHTATTERTMIHEQYEYARRQSSLLQDKNQAGLASEQEYLETLVNTLSIAMNLVDVERTVSDSLISLYKSLGGGW